MRQTLHTATLHHASLPTIRTVTPPTFLSFRAAMTAGRRSICCASRRFFTDACWWMALFSLKFRIVFSWLFRSHVKLWNTPTVTCNSHKPVFCNFYMSNRQPNCLPFHKAYATCLIYSVYNLWTWQCYSYNSMEFCTSVGYIIDNMQPWNVLTLAVVISTAAEFRRQYLLLLSGLQDLWTQQVTSSLHTSTC